MFYFWPIRLDLAIAIFTLFAFAFPRVCFSAPQTHIRSFLVDGAPPPAFRDFSTSTIYSVMSDREGFLWFATDLGVWRFDGKRLLKLSIRDGLGDSEVFKLYQDSQDRIWFLSANGRPSFYKSEKIYNPQNCHFLAGVQSSDFLSGITEDNSGNLWLSGYSGEIFRIDSVGNQKFMADRFLGLSNEQGFPFIRANTLFSFNGDAFAITNLNQIWNLSRKSFVDLPFNIQKSRHAHFNEGKIYAEGHQQLNVYDLLTGKTHFISTKARALDVTYIKAEHGLIYLGSYDGLRVYDAKPPYSLVSLSMEGRSISSHASDLEGNTWVTTLNNGVFFSSALDIKNYNLWPSSDPHISVVQKDPNGRMWIGGLKNNVGYFSQEQFSSLSLYQKKIGRGRINNLFFDSRGTTWICGESGVAQFKQRASNAKGHASIRAIAEDDNGRIYAGTANGLFRFPNSLLPDKLELKEGPSPLEFFRVGRVGKLLLLGNNKILLASRSRIWISHVDSIAPLIDSPPNLKGVSINDIKWSGKELWASLQGKGIFHWEKRGWKLLTTRDGLPTMDFRTILPIGKGTCIIGGSGGVSHVQISKNGGVRISTLDRSDGLLSNKVSALEMDDQNRVWVGSDAGLSVLPLPSFFRERKRIKTYFASVEVNGQKEQVLGGPVFRPSQNRFKFSFSGLVFRKSRHLYFEYKLVGMDTAWKSTDQSSIEYASLSPGKYTFSVRSRIRGEKTVGAPVDYGFEITIPFFQTWWFRTLCLALVLLAGRTYLKQRISRIRKREEIKRSSLEAQQRAIRSQMNPHFIFNSLNSIQLYIAQNDTRKSLSYLTKFSRLVRKTLDSSDSGSVSLAHEIEMLRYYLDLECMRLDHTFSYDVVIENGAFPDQMKIPSLLIQPFVENAIWHGVAPLKENGLISLHFSKRGKVLLCTIEDNGVGRNPKPIGQDKSHNSLGITKAFHRFKLAKELYQLPCQIEIIDKKTPDGKPTGTLVKLKIPLL